MEATTVSDLGSRLTIAEVEAYQRELETVLAGNKNLCINASALQKIDCAGVQLLCSLKKTLLIGEGDLYWKEVSPVLASAAGMLGVDGYLGLA